MRLHLEPFAIACNTLQSAHARLDDVVMVYGELYMHFSNLNSPEDTFIRQRILTSLERRWAALDQEAFLAATLLNPLLHRSPFAEIQEFTVVQVYLWMKRLWIRFFAKEPPVDLFNQVKQYLNEEKKFAGISETAQAIANASFKEVSNIGLYSIILRL